MGVYRFATIGEQKQTNKSTDITDTNILLPANVFFRKNDIKQVRKRVAGK